MSQTSLESMLSEANQIIKRLDFSETENIIKNTNHVIIDVREESEVQSHGLIKNAIHIPRGLIEFKLKPYSFDNPVTIDDDTNILVYCAGGYRSALAAQTLVNLGFNNVYNIGGFGEWVSNGGQLQ
tara:strand:- start:1125 stop:1502 length:378 start_codon:yes stop_codon:yes gene_type:complete